MPITNDRTVYWKTGEFAISALPEALGKDWQWHETTDGATEFRSAWFDTFDWRCWLRDTALLREDNSYALRQLDSWEMVDCADWPDKRPLRRADELPDGGLADYLTDTCGERALFRLAVMVSRFSSYALKNVGSGINCSLELEQLLVRNHKTDLPVGTVIRLRGDTGDMDELLNLYGFERMTSRRQVLTEVLRLTGRSAVDYSMKITTPITASMPCGEAVIRLVRDNFRLLRCNEKGIAGDIDREFLHDYRVAIRRCRTLLAAFEPLFHHAASSGLQELFKHWGNATNRLRDCDVLLEAREKYLLLLPEELRPGLLLFFQRIEAIRRDELRQVREMLASRKYHDFCHHTHSLLADPGRMLKDGVMDCAAELAGDRIYRCYKKVLRDGKGLDADSDDAAWHKVRIRCKRLRYLLEFFAGIFPETVLSRVEALKRLQTTLGEYNDMVVQIDTLKSKVSGHGGRRLAPEAAAAVGGLIALLARDKNALRDEFKSCFKEFSTSGNSTFFKKHFRR